MPINKVLTLIRTILAILSIFIEPASYAAPLWFLEPASKIQLTVPENGNATVQYTVYNKSSKFKRLVMQPLPGIQQLSSCELAPRGTNGSHCTLILAIAGSALPVNGIKKGPVLCLANADGSPNVLQCNQPEPKFTLDISKTGIETAGIAVNSGTLDLIAGSNNPGFLTITNNSTTVAAQNVRATLPAGWADVSQDASDCLLIAPNGGTCQLQFTPGATTHAAAVIPIAGDNTSEVTSTITVSPAPVASIAVINSPLALAANGAARNLITGLCS